jgi:hypothetical protein
VCVVSWYIMCCHILYFCCTILSIYWALCGHYVPCHVPCLMPFLCYGFCLYCVFCFLSILCLYHMSWCLFHGGLWWFPAGGVFAILCPHHAHIICHILPSYIKICIPYPNFPILHPPLYPSLPLLRYLILNLVF